MTSTRPWRKSREAGFLGLTRLRCKSGAASEEACGEDAAVIHNQQVARAKQAGKPSESFGLQSCPVERQRCSMRGSAAVSQGLLRNQLFREVEIKVRNQHQ